jgi:hypothetical protein
MNHLEFECTESDFLVDFIIKIWTRVEDVEATC